MVVETESTKNQPVDILSDLFKIEHQWALLKLQIVVRHIFKHKSTGRHVRCQIYTCTFVLHYLCFFLHLKPRTTTTFNPYCLRGYYR
jgi:hypothetical protein